MLQFKRGKRGVLADYKLDDIYKVYKETSNNPLPRNIISKLYKEIFTEIVKLIVLDNFQFRMPHKLGYLRIKKKEVRPKINAEGELDARCLSIDWKKTKQMWTEKYKGMTPEEINEIKNKPVIRELNEHTDGYRFIWYWDKVSTNISNQNAYYINMTRANKKILSHASKTNELNFFI